MTNKPPSYMNHIDLPCNFIFSLWALTAGEDAIGIYLRSIVWTMDHETNGELPTVSLIGMTTRRDIDHLVVKLVEVGLWAPTKTGWRILGYTETRTPRKCIAVVRPPPMSIAKRRTAKPQNKKPVVVDKGVTFGYVEKPSVRNAPCKTEYKTWCRIIRRCRDASSGTRIYYMDRGIRVCDRWQSDFSAFLSDMGYRPSDKDSIDRIDGRRGYECGSAACSDCGPKHLPINCRWASAKQQSENKSNSVHLTFRGETMLLEHWAQRLDMPTSTLRNRVLVAGWPIDRALTEPVRRRG